MALRPIQFAAQAYEARSGVVTAEKCQNLYLERNPSGAKGQVALYGTPGLKKRQTVGSGPIRGLHAMGGYLWVVSGQELHQVARDGTDTLIGEIKNFGHVPMVDNGVHLGIATSVEAYAANASGIINLPETGMNGVAYQDGYGIFSQGGTEKFWLTGIDDMTTIGALDYSSADVFADLLIGCISDHRELWLFGESTSEVWFNTGNATFPFERSQGGFIERGCASSWSIAKADHRVVWLGDDLAVWVAQGYQPQRISTPPVEAAIAAAVDPHVATAFCYFQGGHTFYVLSTDAATFAYDLTTGLWHTRKSWGIGRWRADCHERIWDLDIVGDYENGDIYQLDLDTYDDDGDTIEREAIAPPLSSAGSRVFMPRFYLDLEAGVGLGGAENRDPPVMLSWSDDGGKNWVDERIAYAGKAGEYDHRAMWTRLGSFRQRSLRVRITDPVKVAIVGAYADLSAGAT